MQYTLRLIVSFVCSSLFPRLNPHSLTIVFRCTSTISRQVFVSSLKLWEPMLLVQKKKNKEINNFKTLCYKDFDMDLCHTCT